MPPPPDDMSMEDVLEPEAYDRIEDVAAPGA